MPLWCILSILVTVLILVTEPIRSWLAIARFAVCADSWAEVSWPLEY